MTEQDLTIDVLSGRDGSRLAYVKPISAEDVQRLYPQAPKLDPGTILYALHAADGTPILLAGSREAAVANAIENELDMVSLH